MKHRAPAIFLVIVALLFFAGVAGLLRMRFSRGDVYPVYSTYRSDPLGARALYESLRLLPGIRAQRWLRDPEKLPEDFHGTLILAGLDRADWETMPAAEAARLDALLRAGARVVVTFTAGYTEQPKPKPAANANDDDDTDTGDHFDALAVRRAKSRKSPSKPPQSDHPGHPDKNAPTAPDAALRIFVNAGEQWGIKLNVYKIRPDPKTGLYPDAQLAPDAPRDLPEKLQWMSELFFEPQPDSPASGAATPNVMGASSSLTTREQDAPATLSAAPWRTLYTRQSRPVLIERQIGDHAGTLVLAADSFFLSNEALQRARATALLAWLVDSPDGAGLVLFDESHLGMEEDTGIAVLARRYGLAGAALVALLFAALWAWRSMALFVPPAPEPEQAETGYDPTAGLEALLRRSIPKSQLAQACLAEWRKSATAPDAHRAEAALAALGAGATQAAAYNALLNSQRKTTPPSAAKPRPFF